MIADELAFSFERLNIPYCFYDLDGQGGVLHGNVSLDNATVAIIDTPGALQSQLRDWIDNADVIVVPTRTTSRDIEPLQRMQRAVQTAEEKGVPVLYVLNCYTRWRASSDFYNWFKQTINESRIFKIPQSEIFVRAAVARVSVVEFAKKSPAAKAIEELCAAVQKAVGIISKI